jgi:hypothetical protein
MATDLDSDGFLACLPGWCTDRELAGTVPRGVKHLEQTKAWNREKRLLTEKEDINLKQQRLEA